MFEFFGHDESWEGWDEPVVEDGEWVVRVVKMEVLDRYRRMFRLSPPDAVDIGHGLCIVNRRVS